MKKISEWSDRAINWFGTVVTIVMIVLLIAFAKYVEKVSSIDPGPEESPVVVSDRLDAGKAFVDTVGFLTLNPDAIIPVGALRDSSEEISDTPVRIIWLYPVAGDINKLEWWAPCVVLLSCAARSDMATANYYNDSGGLINIGNGFPYIIMTI